MRNQRGMAEKNLNILCKVDLRDGIQKEIVEMVTVEIDHLCD